ncbi:MAG: AAA family ATPase [Solirubrobacterales bacterium]|nr:AAA family ATPase [Solirubrobacterales bacterium]
MSVAERLVGKKICIVAGSGGVGKTTSSAALALGLAAAGQRACVITIDPAKRLANALGMEELGNEPKLVDPAVFAAEGLEMEGELWAMMLDAKATFDGLIERLAPDAKTRDEILENRIYKELSGAVAGSQEFTAVARVYDLHREGGFDVLILDTPPSRNALDFLDAPARISQFFQGRAIKVFLAPTNFAARVVGRGTSVVFSVMKRVTGVDLLDDLSVFFRALGGIIDGFTERAAGVKALLADPATTFLIVTSPQKEPVDEAIFFRGKLREAGMPFGGLIVNRVDPGVGEADPLDPETVVAELSEPLGEALAKKVGRTVEDAQVLADRDTAAIAHLRAELDEREPILVPRLDADVHDVAGLVAVQRHLFAPAADRERLLAEAGGE